MLGVLAVIVSIILIAIPRGLLQIAGGALLATALSLISSTIVGGQAVHQQFSKEANLVRKNESYAPLQEELNRLFAILKEAKEGNRPYPAWINGVENEPEIAKYQQHLYNPASFMLWPDFKNNYHAGHFSAEASRIFDEVFRLASSFNAAIQLAHQPSIDILTPHIAKAIEVAKKTEPFREWQEQTRARTRIMQQGDDYWQWLENNSASTFPGFIAGRDIAASWVTSYGALEWLINGNTDKAASKVHNAYKPNMSSAPEHDWIQSIFEAALPELEEQAHFKKVRFRLALLLTQVSIAKQKVDAGLLYIRDTYEGGAPPI